MLLTLLNTAGPQGLQSMLTGEQNLGSSGGGGVGAIIGTVIGLMIGIAAVVINYRRNNSFFYAFLAFIFSEIYLAFVFVKFLFKKTGL